MCVQELGEHQLSVALFGSLGSSLPPQPKPGATRPAVCIIVPALNEASYIEACLASLLRQIDCNIAEIIVADGGSTDGTPALVEQVARNFPIVRLLHNSGRIQSAGVNLAALQADRRAEILIRADAHVEYAPAFVVQCVTAMQKSGATSVAVPMRTVGKTGFQRATAFAQNSKLGNGGAAHRSSGGRCSGFVDHGHHAAFNRQFFEACGGYDETFTHNEDAELDYRAHLAGGRVWLCVEACVNYYPRSTPLALARQYLRNGRGRARTLVKHGMRPRLRQFAPVLVLLAVLGGLILTPVWWPFVLIPLIYLALCSVAGVYAAFVKRDPWLLASGVAIAIMHLSFGTGFLQTLAKYAFNERGAIHRDAANNLTGQTRIATPLARRIAAGTDDPK